MASRGAATHHALHGGAAQDGLGLQNSVPPLRGSGFFYLDLSRGLNHPNKRKNGACRGPRYARG